MDDSAQLKYAQYLNKPADFKNQAGDIQNIVQRITEVSELESRPVNGSELDVIMKDILKPSKTSTITRLSQVEEQPRSKKRKF